MSIRKRQWTTAKGEKKFAWMVDYFDQSRTRRLKTFPTKKEATDFSAQMSVDVRAGVHTPDSASITVAAAAKAWLRSADRAGLERATCDQYRQHVDLHIVPFIGGTRLSQLTVPAVRAFEDRLLDEGRSEAMARKVLASLSSILTDAIERGKVHRNVVKEMRGRRRRGAERRALARRKGRLKVGVDIPTPDEIRTILAAIKGRWRPLLLTAVFTGLRASELRGLRWVNVDLDAGLIHVRERADRYNAQGAPKSEAGDRTVPMTPMLVNTLKEWKLETGGQGLVFGNGRGNVENLGNIINRGLIPPQIAAGLTVPKLDKAGQPVLDKNGQQAPTGKYTGMHALRHFYASWCINPRTAGGLELLPKVVQARLGHASIQITFDSYGHLFPSADDSETLAAGERSVLG
jgi:integrase